MKVKKVLLTLACVVMLMACNSKKNIEAEHSHSNHEHTHQEAGIALNNGTKWKVNADMLPHINAMEDAVAEFNSEDASAVNELGEALKAHNKELISSCTMKGDAHNELHKWLHPYMDLLEKLSAVDDQDEGKKLLEELKASFSTFHTYFE